MILVLTPLRIEHDALASTLGRAQSTERIGSITVSRFTPGLMTAVGGHGKVQFALTAQFLAERLKPRLLICAGAGGALVEQVKLFDLVAAQKTVEHDFNLRVLNKPLPSFAGHAPSLEKLKNLSNLHLGPIASGDEDIVERRRADELHMLTGALAVGWEGAGGARACQFANTPFLELRVATDLCDQNVAQDFATNVRAGLARIKEALDILTVD